MTNSIARVTIAAVILIICAQGSATAQVPDKSRTLGSLMIDSPEKKRQFLIGLAEALSTKHPKLRLSALTKCFEEAADSPANWPKDVKLFVPTCAASASGE